MKRIAISFILILSFLLVGCAGHSPKAICDGAQKAYATANASAIALYAAGAFTDEQWNTCVVPLDTRVNLAVVNCYKFVLAGTTAEQIQAIADTARSIADLLKNPPCK